MFDVLVIGAGHAGIEACMASVRMKKKTALITLNIDMAGSMPCNPSVGGPAKGIVVREIDALGGIMPIVADKTALQFKMLNTTKGPGVWSLRVQSDKEAYKKMMKEILLNTEGLTVIEAACHSVIIEDGKATGVRLEDGRIIEAKTVILTTGTYMTSTILRGHTATSSGPEDQPTVNTLSESLRMAGIKTFRLKTGTPCRVLKDSIDFSKAEVQPGTNEFLSFSTTTKEEDVLPFDQQEVCHLIYTTPTTHQIINDHLHDSAMYSGLVKGVGPRYCPSIEDKLVRFADKERHQLFLEPEGETTREFYLNGFSSSLPLEIQLNALQKIPAFKDIQIYRPGYAIEYDYFDPTQLLHNLETKKIKNLFFAGQVNGTTGYEEAAGQGIIAGINAHINCHGGNPFILARNEAYIGVLIDDLVTKGVDEPYRMFTSRAEYRILLRQDDADMRLTEKSYNLGLASTQRHSLLIEKKEHINHLIEFAKNYSVKPQYINSGLEQLGTSPLKQGIKLIDLILRPQLSISKIAELIPALHKEIDKIKNRKDEIIEATEIRIKYEGYIDREKMIADKISRLENIRIKGKFDYNSIKQLSTEARQKLDKIDPETIAQAARIPGISPSDINILLVLSGR